MDDFYDDFDFDYEDDGDEGPDEFDESGVWDTGADTDEDHEDLDDEPGAGDSANLSWEELAVSMGFAQEMYRGERRSERIKQVEKGDEAGDAEVNPHRRNKDSEKAPCSAIQAGDLGRPEKMALVFEDIDNLLSVLNMRYNELTARLTPINLPVSARLPTNMQRLEMDVARDLVRLLRQAVFLDTKDLAHILIRGLAQVSSEKVMLIKKYLDYRGEL
ncbi:MAG: hypothetical protein ACLFNW_11370 [Desulfobacterales bacterium]